MILPLAIPVWATGLLVGAFLVVCVIMILVVLIQRPQGGGLSRGEFGAGGGGSAGQTAFGTKTGDALTYATIGMFLLYLAFAVGLNFATRPENLQSSAQPSVVSTDPVETSDSGPLDLDEGTEGTTTETGTDPEAEGDDEGDEPPAGEPPTTTPATVGADAALDAIDQAEQTARQIVDDAADAVTDPAATPPAENPAQTPAETPSETDSSDEPATPPTI